MGWLSGWNSKKELLEHLRSKYRFGEHLTLVKSNAIGNNHWYIVRNNKTLEESIGLDVIEGDFGTKKSPQWGYKSMGESAGPIACDCPLGYLKHCEAPNDYAAAWRERVKAFHGNKAEKKSLAEGAIVIYQAVEYKILNRLGRSGWQVKSLVDQAIYKMSNIQMNKAEIKSA